MTSVRGHARTWIIDAADRLFYRDGIRVTSVDAIAAEAGVTKRTFYHHFETKGELVADYLTHRDEPARKRLFAYAERTADAPNERILSVFEALGYWFASEDFRGCAFLNAVAEAGQSPKVRLVALTHKLAIRAWFRDQLADAGSSDAENIADMLMVVFDGAIACALVQRSAAPARAARCAASAILAASR